MLSLAFVWQVVAALRPLPWIAEHLTVDDTYLALQVGLNWSEHGFPTFDGLHRTNGFQALWGIVLRGLASITQDYAVLLRLCLVLVATLSTVTGLLLWRLARGMESGAGGVWTAAFWAMFCVSGRPAMIGLENALAGTIVAAALLQMRQVVRDPSSKQRWLLVAVLLGALCWTRLDGAILVAAAMLGLLMLARRRRAWKGAGLFCGVLAVSAGLLVAFNLWAADTPTPISGMVKRHIARGLEPSWTPTVVGTAVLESGQLWLKSASAGIGMLWPRAVSAAVRAGIVVVLAIALARRWLPLTGWTVLWVVALFSHIVMIRLWLSHYYADTLWYYAPENVSACLWVGLACAALGRRILLARQHACLPVALTLLRMVVAAAALAHVSTEESVTRNRLAAAAWLKQHVRPGERAGAWNAGELAYFSGCVLINLDGLVNDRAYFERIKAGRTGETYLDEQNVTWVVDYARNLWWLPRERWEEVASFGSRPEMEQLVLRRRPGSSP